jgi:hypothetical protein
MPGSSTVSPHDRLPDPPLTRARGAIHSRPDIGRGSTRTHPALHRPSIVFDAELCATVDNGA